MESRTENGTFLDDVVVRAVVGTSRGACRGHVGAVHVIYRGRVVVVRDAVAVLLAGERDAEAHAGVRRGAHHGQVGAEGRLAVRGRGDGARRERGVGVGGRGGVCRGAEERGGVVPRRVGALRERVEVVRGAHRELVGGVVRDRAERLEWSYESKTEVKGSTKV